jgi:hypothetical protein
MMMGCGIGGHVHVVFVMTLSSWICNFICKLTCSIS